MRFPTKDDPPTVNGVFFIEPDHPVCAKCVSSLYQDESCPECGGDGWVERDDCDDGETDGVVACPECHADPPRWRCPTCKRSWAASELWPTGESKGNDLLDAP